MYLFKRLLAVAVVVFLAAGLPACEREEPATTTPTTPENGTTAPDTGAETAAPDTETPPNETTTPPAENENP